MSASGARGTSILVQPLSIVYSGLDGLPLGRADRPSIAWYGDMSLGSHLLRLLAIGPVDVSAARARPGVIAACTAADLGEPALLILESPVQAQFEELKLGLLNAVAAARDAWAAVIWLTRSDLVWSDRSFPATHRFRLGDRGLMPARHAA